MTEKGECVQYHETLLQHFERISTWMKTEPQPIGPTQIGLERGKILYGLSKQGMFGDRADDKPNGNKKSAFDILGRMKYNAWEK